MWKFEVAEEILNEIVSPLLTLIAVAKPWIDSSPYPSTSHWLRGTPACVFSHATALTTGGVHGAASDAAGARPKATREAASVAAPRKNRRAAGARAGRVECIRRINGATRRELARGNAGSISDHVGFP